MKKVYSDDYKYKLYERILALERKYAIPVPNPDIIENMIDSPNVYHSLEWRTSNLEFNLGEPVHNLLGYDERLKNLKEHTYQYVLIMITT